MSFNKKIILSIIIFTLFFLILVISNISPLLRGPGDWPPEWRWPFLFINTLNKVFAPLILIFLVIVFNRLVEVKKIKIKPFYLLFIVVLLSFLFQLAIIFFSRSGLYVLIHRIINPDLNGYFTEAIKINDLGNFIQNYQNNVLNFSMHATGHPPGPIIFFWLLKNLFKLTPFINQLTTIIIPKHQDVLIIWSNLTAAEKTTAVFSAFFIPLLGSVNIIPLYLLGKELFNIKTSVKAIFLAIFIPAFIFFTPLSDVYFPLFYLLSTYFLVKGIKKDDKYFIFISGLVFSLGLFFSLSLLPLLLINIYYLLINKNKHKVLIFLSGLIVFNLTLFIFKYNAITTSYVLMTGLPKNRSYYYWVIYNLYDFFVFTGIPITTIYLSMLFKKIKEPLFASFSLMLFGLSISGLVRGEVGRIWIPFIYPLILIISNYLVKNLKINSKYFIIILISQALQVIVLQEFWVMLW